jgi:predicted peroxiredoxin
MIKFVFFFFLLSFSTAFVYSQSNTECGTVNPSEAIKPIKMGIVISTNDAETVWNSLRLANYSRSEGDSVSIFLLGKGVELQTINDKTFDVQGQLDDFLKSGGKILACGTCMRSRNMEESNVCPISSLSDLYDLIRKSDKVLTF